MPASDGELVAWQAGVDWGRAGLSRTAYATSSAATLSGLLDEAATEALRQMGRDIFGHWFLMGLADTTETPPPCPVCGRRTVLGHAICNQAI